MSIPEQRRKQLIPDVRGSIWDWEFIIVFYEIWF